MAPLLAVISWIQRTRRARGRRFNLGTISLAYLIYIRSLADGSCVWLQPKYLVITLWNLGLYLEYSDSSVGEILGGIFPCFFLSRLP